MMTPPSASRSAASSAASSELVKTPACSPKRVPFARATASSKVSNALTTTTGPKASSQLIFASSGTFASTVGLSRPSSSPPVRISPPDSAIHARRRVPASSSITGPTSVSSSAGSPTPQGLDLRDERVEERVEMRAVDVDPLDADAALACEGEGGRSERRRGDLDLGVLRDDRRRRVAELELCALGRCALLQFQPTSPEPVKVI